MENLFLIIKVFFFIGSVGCFFGVLFNKKEKHTTMEWVFAVIGAIMLLSFLREPGCKEMFQQDPDDPFEYKGYGE